MAPIPVPTMMAVGVARPRAHGQAITTTEMEKSNEKRNGVVPSYQISDFLGSPSRRLGSRYRDNLPGSLYGSGMPWEDEMINQMMKVNIDKTTTIGTNIPATRSAKLYMKKIRIFHYIKFSAIKISAIEFFAIEFSEKFLT